MPFRLTPIVRNLLIINVVMFILQELTTYYINIPGLNRPFPMSDVQKYLALFDFKYSAHFMPHQIFTHIFLHGGLSHLFFNMFSLVIFGTMLESFLGDKKFLFLYIIAGIGGGILHSIIRHYELVQHFGTYVPDPEYMVMSTLGASGAIYGLLFAAAYFFPNQEMVLLFPPIPIKLKYLAIGMAVIEVFMGIQNNPGDNIAHFAHLGGMLFAFILIFIWKQKDGARNH